MPGTHHPEPGPPVHLWAAGSLRAVLTHLGEGFQRETRHPVEGTFGPSGLLRERLEGGERAHLFAPASLPHARLLAGRAGWLPAVRCALNPMWVLARPEVALQAETVLDTLLDPALTLGTSTPTADPSGDYAWEVFRKAEAARPGSLETLVAKVRRLTGGPNPPDLPRGRSVYAHLLAEGAADVFLTYRSNVLQALRAVPELQAAPLPPPLAVAGDVALTLAADAPPQAVHFAMVVLSPEGQAALEAFGLEPLG